MRAFVFTDAKLARYAGQFVWLSVDTENARNAAFLQKFPIHVWPTLMIVDPKQESVILHYAGGATTEQLGKLLTEGEKTYRAKSLIPSDRMLASADKLVSEDRPGDAVKLYEKALAEAPKTWASRGRAAESYTITLLLDHQNEPCAIAARKLYPELRGTTSGANVASNGLACATELPADHAGRSELIAYLEEASRAALADKKMGLSGDDRSGLYESLVSAREDAKDDAGAKKLREQWAAFLEGEAARAKTPEQRAVYDSHRVGVYLAMKTPEKAIPMLEQSARDFPNDYNPQARLALAYRAMGKFDEALAANQKALNKAYGPRKIGIYRNRADILMDKGEKAAAQQTLEEAIRYAKDLPVGQRSDPMTASLEKKLADIKSKS